MSIRRALIGFPTLGLLMFSAATVQADAVSDFYKGKDINLFIGSATGGGYDTTARLLARHYSRHIPGNPGIIPRNMPGAGSLAMTNHVSNIAPKDGTAIGAPQNTAGLERLLHLLSPEGKNANYDAEKLNWIGSPSQDIFLLVAWHTAPVKTFDDLKKTELIVGSAGPSTDHSITAQLLNNMFGTKMKIVAGYVSGQEVMLAMERGEVQGNSGRAYSSLMSGWSDWVRDKKVKILLQMGIEPHPNLPNVPSATQIATTPEDRQVLELIFAKYQMSRPYFAPAGVPADRVQALRRGFDAVMKDAQFLADAKKTQIDIEPVTGEDVQSLIERLYRDSGASRRPRTRVAEAAAIAVYP